MTGRSSFRRYETMNVYVLILAALVAAAIAVGIAMVEVWALWEMVDWAFEVVPDPKLLSPQVAAVAMIVVVVLSAVRGKR